MTPEQHSRELQDTEQHHDTTGSSPLSDTTWEARKSWSGACGEVGRGAPEAVCHQFVISLLLFAVSFHPTASTPSTT